jgi:uncharacterized protein GlcG (DUF336 family)
MTRSIIGAACLFFAITAGAQVPSSGGSGFPGDHGRPFGGMPLPDGPLPPRPPEPPPAKSAPLALVLEAAEAIVAACKGYHIAVSVIDAAATPKLYYVADGTGGAHAYTGFRKAYTALSFRMPTSQVGPLTKTDPAVVAKIKEDPNLLSFAGGMLLKSVGGEILGAIGVSGAEPSAKDEECGLVGIGKIQSRLQ